MFWKRKRGPFDPIDPMDPVEVALCKECKDYMAKSHCYHDSLERAVTRLVKHRRDRAPEQTPISGNVVRIKSLVR